MERTIRINASDITIEGILHDSKTAAAIWEALPLSARANTWGDEIYFGIPLNLGLEKGQEVVEVGALGYWPPGKAFCIFFGLTPASQGNEVRPASAVTVFGQIPGDATILKKVRSGSQVTIERKNG